MYICSNCFNGRHLHPTGTQCKATWTDSVCGCSKTSSLELALVEFTHGSGCDVGQPYGTCVYTCTWRTVQLFRHANILAISKWLESLGYMLAKFRRVDESKSNTV